MSFFFKVYLPCLVIIVCISQPIFADHGPQRMFGRQIQPYFSAHETKQVGPFKINLHTYGEDFKYDLSNINNQKYDHIFDDKFNVIHSEVSRNANAYPVIKTGYQEHIDVIKDWLSSLPNITAIGRSGMFKYNNQDHAMATGLYAARTLLGQGDYDPWEVNVDGEYLEELSSN